MSRPRPILLSTDALGGLDGVLEVADTWRHLLIGLAERDLHIEVLGPRSRGRREGGDRARAIGRAGGRAPSSVQRNVGAVAARGYALVHTTTVGPLGEFSRAVARSSGARFVVSHYGATASSLHRRLAATSAVEAGGGSVAQRIESLCDSADLVLAPTRAVQRTLADRLAAPVAVLGRGVDSRIYHPDRRARPHGRPLRALYAGWLADGEELKTLVRVFGDRDDVELVIAGDGPLRCALERLLPRVTFRGSLRGAERARCFADADIFLVPSRTDAFDHGILQALSSGVPVVAFSGFGRDEVIQDGVSGIIVDDDDEFAAAISFLAAGENARLEMGLEARRRAARFRWDTVVEDLLALYAALISDRPPLVA